MVKGFKKIKFSSKHKTKRKKKSHLKKECIIILKLIKKLFILIFVSIIFLFRYTHFSKDNNTKNYLNNLMNISSSIDPVEELANIKKYIKDVYNLSYLDKDKVFYPTNHPLISVVISVYNGEGFLNRALVSIQNQDLKDIEIVMIDDCSIDNSVNLIKDLMTKEPRIKLYQNKENRGALYTKTKGILLSKGKYILLLDEDDIYVQKDAFSSLYKIAEINNLDILRFISISTKPSMHNINYNKINKTFPIIFQPELSNVVFKQTKNGKLKLSEGMLHNYFIKRDLYIKVIEQIDEKYLNTKMVWHDDALLLFLLTRKAYNFLYLDRIFHIHFISWNVNDKKIKFRNKDKYKGVNYKRCSSYLNFIEFVLDKTENNIIDKKLAFLSYDRWFLSKWCRNLKETYEQAIKISKQYLENKYIQEEDKNKIKAFFTEKNITYKL